MRPTATRAQLDADAKTPRDSASQVSRATLGLREMLLRGALRPGQRIAEIALSKKLGVSRTPLRLAFEKLENEGLIKALPHSGFAAREFTITDIWDAIETRGILEGAAARLAAERLKNPAQLEPLRNICRAMEEVLTLDVEAMGQQYIDLNEAFHSAILDLGGNRVLRRSVKQVNRLPFGSPSALVILHMNVTASKEALRIAQEHHRAIVESIEHREGSRAESLAREHSYVPRRHLEQMLEDRKLLEAIPGGPLVKYPNAVQT